MNTKDLRKHKKDVLRLLQLFAIETSLELPDSIKRDVGEFVAMVEREGAPLEQMGIDLSLDEAIGLMKGAYGL